MKLKIKKASLNDAESIQKIINQSWRDTYSDFYSNQELKIIFRAWHKLSSIKEQINDQHTTFLLAEVSGKTVGIVSGIIENKEATLDIEKLHVSSKYKFRGIGKLLLEELINSTSGIELLELGVIQENKPAISFYEKQGFHISREEIYSVKNVTIPCYIMRKQLTT